jgi:hypothetical protein
MFVGQHYFTQRTAACPPDALYRPGRGLSSYAASNMSVRNTVKSIQDIMRQDVGADGDAQRISQL